jgi:hypothetical protein
MATGVEKNEFIEVPAAPGIERPPQEGRFRFRLLTNDRVEVHHPFHSPTILPDLTYLLTFSTANR